MVVAKLQIKLNLIQTTPASVQLHTKRMLFVDLRVGSKPVMKSGQRARAAAPAGVAGQHIHPSHVPGQYESAREYKRYRIN